MPWPRRGSSLSPEALKKRKRNKIILAAVSTILVLTGLLVIGGTYYFVSVPTPGELPMDSASKVYSADGALVGQIGDTNRQIVDRSAIPDIMKKAIVSAEDRTFYTNSGVDFKSIVRALWNNLTGGQTQGASTITQQYARMAAKLDQSHSYTRKLKEAAIAMKLDKQYSKDEILGFYLNTSYFYRGAYGVGAASEAWFHKDLSKLTPAEAALLAAQVKSPDGTYDPTENPDTAKSRWDYVMDGLVKLGAISQADRDKAQLPKVNKYVPAGEYWKKPVYQIMKYVKEEMAAKGVTDLDTGGYTITVSVDSRLQNEAVVAASSRAAGMPMAGQDTRLASALVAVQPGTGRVLAYYGGSDGSGTDYAGYTKSSDGKIHGGHPPGSSMKAYVLAEALQNHNFSEYSHVDGIAPTKYPGRAQPIANSDGEDPCGHYCTLKTATVYSLNIPYYYMTSQFGPAKVLEMAKQAGIRYMWPDGTFDGIDITKKPSTDLAPDKFDREIGIGQYPITVLDQANGYATFANNGVGAREHFVTKVVKGGQVLYTDAKDLGLHQVVSPQVASVMDDILKNVKPRTGPIDGGNRPAAAKTGTWQLDSNPNANAHAWISGYTPQIAATVWVGAAKTEFPLRWSHDGYSESMYGSGLPGNIWKRFMERAHQVMNWDVKQFPPAANIGDTSSGNGASPSPAPGPQDKSSLCKVFPALCPTGGDKKRRGGQTSPSPAPSPSTVPSPSPSGGILPGG